MGRESIAFRCAQRSPERWGNAPQIKMAVARGSVKLGQAR
jgi:hypothetical protein